MNCCQPQGSWLLFSVGIWVKGQGRGSGFCFLRAIKLLSSYHYRSALFRPGSGMLSRLRFPIRSICTRIAHRETGKDTEALLGEDISPIRGSVRPSVRQSVGPSVRLIGGRRGPLDASSQLYKTVYRSIGLSVHRSVHGTSVNINLNKSKPE